MRRPVWPEQSRSRGEQQDRGPRADRDWMWSLCSEQSGRWWRVAVGWIVSPGKDVEVPSPGARECDRIMPF